MFTYRIQDLSSYTMNAGSLNAAQGSQKGNINKGQRGVVTNGVGIETLIHILDFIS